MKAGSGMLLAHLALATLALATPPSARAAMTRVSPLAVRILYDNSGSMYPGYQPGGPGKSELGVGFFREYPEFRRWLADFAALQSVLNGQTVTLAAVTSGSAFDAAGDFTWLQPEVPLARFDADSLERLERDHWGRQTYLAQALAAFTRDFEGLVWLLTDNYVDTGSGELDEQVVAFFESLRDGPRYQAVHLFKLPFEDAENGRRSDLAIYGVLVSPEAIDDDTAMYFDRKFRDALRTAQRPGGRGPLLPEHEHLKLKDLDVDSLELVLESTVLEPRFTDHQRGWFRELRKVELQLPGEIKSHLTQHAVTGGRYDLELAGTFKPDKVARERFGVDPVQASEFGRASGRLSSEIPPGGSYLLHERLTSKQAIGLVLPFWGKLKAALFGPTVEYTGTVRMTFSEVRVRFERSQMRGIFGSELASEVFDFAAESRIYPGPAETEVRFQLATSPRRWLLLLAFLLPFLTLCAAIARLATDRDRYRIVVDGRQEIVPLRRLGRRAIAHGRYRLGHLRRGLDGRHGFTPGEEDVAVRIEAEARAGHYVAHVRDHGAVLFSIEPLRGGAGGTSPDQPRRPGGGGTSGPAPARQATATTARKSRRPSPEAGAAPPRRRPGAAVRRP